MPIISTKRMFDDALKGKYAIGAFNVENTEMLRAVTSAAVKNNAVVILQTTSSTLKYLEPEYFSALARTAEKEMGAVVALHLDHGSSYELAKRCIDCGYSSVMFDGSKLSFEENIAITKKVVDYANLFGVSVEAELGTVGGKEDETESEGNCYTNPAEAAEFVAQTGVHSLAIAFGTAHGFYKTEPVLDLELIKRVRDMVSIPLVMHGASGVSASDVSRSIENGICKVNYATELRNAFSDGIKDYLLKNPKEIDPKKYFTVAAANVEALVSNIIINIGSKGSNVYSL